MPGIFFLHAAHKPCQPFGSGIGLLRLCFSFIFTSINFCSLKFRLNSTVGGGVSVPLGKRRGTIAHPPTSLCWVVLKGAISGLAFSFMPRAFSYRGYILFWGFIMYTAEEKKFYTPQFSEMACVSVYRLSQVMGISMVDVVNIMVKLLPSYVNSKKICLDCPDNSKCHVCLFSQEKQSNIFCNSQFTQKEQDALMSVQ